MVGTGEIRELTQTEPLLVSAFPDVPTAASPVPPLAIVIGFVTVRLDPESTPVATTALVAIPVEENSVISAPPVAKPALPVAEL
jgi:hypothetical protein